MQLYSIVLSAALRGMSATLVQVEVDVSSGLPSFQMVGSVSTEIKESVDRVRTAIKNSGFQLQPRKIVGNLSPANLRKTGVSYDLPIAVGVLSAYGIIKEETVKNHLFVGELSLTGRLQRINGVLPIVLMAKKRGIHNIIVPVGNLKEVSIIDGVQVYGADSIESVVEHLNKKKVLEKSVFKKKLHDDKRSVIDFSDVKGQVFVKRALTIAVAGCHNVLMIGPPGAGKSMLSKRIPSIFPDLSLEESIEVSQIYSVAGLLKEESPFIDERPFRNVHHTVTRSALIGGGSMVKPGEISLSHKGVLFLDEIAEFPRSVLEALRQPLEEKKIIITRNKGSYEFEADFMLIAAMNPCPCGNYPDLEKCICSNYEIKRYLNKISQPLLDRMDMSIDVPRVKYEELKNTQRESESKSIKRQVENARNIQSSRYYKNQRKTNATIKESEMHLYCALDEKCEELMKKTYQKLEMTARSYHKVIKVARTIADLEGEKEIKEEHLLESIGYRMCNQLHGKESL